VIGQQKTAIKAPPAARAALEALLLQFRIPVVYLATVRSTALELDR